MWILQTSHLCLKSSLERLDSLKFWSPNFVSWNLQQHLIDLATFAEEDQRRVSFTTFQQCQCRLFEVKRTAVKQWFGTNLPKMATQEWYDWHVTEYTVPKSSMSLEYESETQDKRQLCTEGILETLLQDIFGRIVFRIFLKGTCRISIYRVHRN